jgi:hypothetical protein
MRTVVRLYSHLCVPEPKQSEAGRSDIRRAVRGGTCDASALPRRCQPPLWRECGLQPASSPQPAQSACRATGPLSPSRVSPLSVLGSGSFHVTLVYTSTWLYERVLSGVGLKAGPLHPPV